MRARLLGSELDHIHIYILNTAKKSLRNNLQCFPGWGKLRTKGTMANSKIFSRANGGLEQYLMEDHSEWESRV